MDLIAKKKALVYIMASEKVAIAIETATIQERLCLDGIAAEVPGMDTVPDPKLRLHESTNFCVLNRSCTF